MDILERLKSLTALPGLSGYEGPIRAAVHAAWEPLVNELSVDALGSLWGVKRGSGPHPRPKIMLAAHMDAIGLMVTKVDGEFLRVTQVGGIDIRVMPGQPVTVHGREDLPGVVGQPPAFLLPRGQEGASPLDQLVVDTGLPADKLAGLVKIGDVISFAQPPRELQNGLLAARSLDNRASVVAVTAALDELQKRTHAWDVVAIATVQEEVGLRGATPAAFALNPELAIAIDVTHASGPYVKDNPDGTFPLGGGPVLGLGPNIHAGLHAAVKAAAERIEMGLNFEFMAGHSGTDAFGIQVAREGIPTMVISIPLRYMHTPVEVVSTRDVARTGRLLAEFIAGLEPDFMSKLTHEIP